MELIVGGAYQGKWKYAKKMFPQASWVRGEDCTLEALLQADGVYGFHDFLGRQMDAGEDARRLPEMIMEKNPELIIVSNEVGYGVVPIESRERAFRELVGRVSCDLAARARRVHRVICGMGTVIKDA